MDNAHITEPALAKIIAARVMDFIIKPVKKAVEDSPYASKLMGGVVLTGGGAMLRHLKELFQYELARPTRIGRPEFGFVNTLQTDLKHPMYATALGLLEYAIITNEDEGQPVHTDVDDEYEHVDDIENDPDDPDTPVGHGILRGFLDKVKGFLQNILKATA